MRDRASGVLQAIKWLNPGFIIDGIKVVLVPTEIVAIRRGLLGPPVASLAKEHFAITAALDLMLTGIEMRKLLHFHFQQNYRKSARFPHSSQKLLIPKDFIR